MLNPLALIIEDEEDLQYIFSEALRLAGFETAIAGDGREALAQLGKLTPALITLDLNLPYVPGPAILQHIRSEPRLAHTRVILITAQAQGARVLQDDADLTLIKPIRIDQLTDLARRLRSQMTDLAN
jgi:CheY-like chemotaxis protein